MANVPRSSFIPKQVTSATPKKVRHTRVFSILAFVSGALLLISLLLSAGVLIYKNIVTAELEAQQTALATAKVQFDEQDMAEIRAFNKRITLAQTLLDSHIAPSKIFEALETATKQSVQYTSFAYVRRPSGDVSLDLFGVTDDFAKVALQSMENSEDFILKEAAVTEVGISLEGSGDTAPVAVGGSKQVNFKIVANVPASKLIFTSESNADILQPNVPSVVPSATSTDMATTTEEITPAGDPDTETVPESGTSTVPGGTQSGL